MDSEIILSNCVPFAKGNHRNCYVNPLNSKQCIKVEYNTDSKKYSFDNLRLCNRSPNLFEYDYYMQLQKRIGNKTDLVLPKVYGMVRTDIGTGLCVELVLDDDGNISKTLKQAVRSTSVTPEVKNAIQDFFCKLLELGIEIKDPGISNIALKKDSTGQISAKLIDGFGTHSILPLSRWFTSIRTRRIQAKINKISARSGISTTKG